MQRCKRNLKYVLRIKHYFRVNAGSSVIIDALQCCQIVNVIPMGLLCLSEGGFLFLSPERDQKGFSQPKQEIYSNSVSVWATCHKYIIEL